MIELIFVIDTRCECPHCNHKHSNLMEVFAQILTGYFTDEEEDDLIEKSESGVSAQVRIQKQKNEALMSDYFGQGRYKNPSQDSGYFLKDPAS